MLTRKVNEVIVIDDVISLRVLKILGDRVCLGIVAPENVSVHRQELLHESAVSGWRAASGQSRDLFSTLSTHLRQPLNVVPGDHDHRRGLHRFGKLFPLFQIEQCQLAE